MNSFFSIFKNSAKELKSVRCLSVTGIFIAVSMILETFTIQIPYAKINFAFLAIAVIGMLFGPVVATMAGGICDIVGFLAHPDGGFLPIYILIAMLQGFIYGIILYNNNKSKYLEKNGKLWLCVRAVIARLLDVVIINLCLNTIANMHYGFIPQTLFSEAVKVRAVKNIIELVADIPLLIVILPLAFMAYQQIQKGVIARNV